MINSFEKLEVFRKAHQLTLEVYKISKTFPDIEKFRLTDQLCRSVASVPANIVEGNSRKTKKEFVQFLYQAKGSLAETQYHLLLAKDLKFISMESYSSLIKNTEEVSKLLSGLLRYLKSAL